MIQKILLGLFLLIGGFQVLASESVLDLDKQQEKIILDRLNDICGDMWCEGEYNLNFTSVQYHQQLNQYYAIIFTAQASYAVNQPQYALSCEIENIALIQTIISNAVQSKYDPSETELFELVDRCIAEKLQAKTNP